MEKNTSNKLRIYCIPQAREFFLSLSGLFLREYSHFCTVQTQTKLSERTSRAATPKYSKLFKVFRFKMQYNIFTYSTTTRIFFLDKMFVIPFVHMKGQLLQLSLRNEIQERLANSQRWASFPPEVTVKSLPLPTNLKIVTVTSFSLPA
jgi:hypothetical protein